MLEYLRHFLVHMAHLWQEVSCTASSIKILPRYLHIEKIFSSFAFGCCCNFLPPQEEREREERRKVLGSFFLQHFFIAFFAASQPLPPAKYFLYQFQHIGANYDSVASRPVSYDTDRMLFCAPCHTSLCEGGHPTKKSCFVLSIRWAWMRELLPGAIKT